jgi:hypothetical protein
MSEDEMPKHVRTIMSAKSVVLGAVLAWLPSLSASQAYAVGPGVCGAFMEQYSIQPYRNWGSMPPRMQPIWDDSDCNHKICQRVWDTPAVDCNNQV